MRATKLRNNEQQKPSNTLRRSPRFLPGKQTGIEYPETPNLADRKPHTDSFSTPNSQKNGGGILKILTKPSKGSARLDCVANLSRLNSPKQYVAENRGTRSSICGSRFVSNQLNNCGEISEKDGREVTVSKCSDKSIKGLRRSARLKGRANVGKEKQVLDSQKQHTVEKRATRCSFRINKSVNSDINSENDSSEVVRVVSLKVGVDISKQSIGNTEKRVTRSATRMKTTQSVEKADGALIDRPHTVVISDERNLKEDGELNSSKGNVKNMQIGEKRKRDQVEEECDFIRGWTEEQELSLRRAYFAAKPTPHFWKKVARMVPGKSAEECFNRIHSDHLTPPQPRTRSRANRKEPSPLSYSASKLLSSADIKPKRQSTRRRTLIAQKTVRQLLEKQCTEDQDHKADLFSVFEPSLELSPRELQRSTAFASPLPNRGSSILTRCLEMSSSAPKKHLSRLNNSRKAGFVSPPVLKQIKNKALHEKYIDQLHCRDAKRKAQSLRNAKSIQEKADQKASPSEVNLIKVAKDALVFDAQDAISKFQNLQSSLNFNTDDNDDITSGNDEDEDEV